MWDAPRPKVWKFHPPSGRKIGDKIPWKCDPPPQVEEADEEPAEVKVAEKADATESAEEAEESAEEAGSEELESEAEDLGGESE